MPDPAYWMKGRTEKQFWIDLALGALFEMLELDLLECSDKETTACKEHWLKDDPAHGHCAAFALLVQDIFGGELLRASLEGLPKYAHMRSHYWNLLPKRGSLEPRKTPFGEEVVWVDIEVDLSASQFEGRDRNLVPAGEVRTREYVLSNPDTARRYELLKKRLEERNPDLWKK